MSIYLGRIVAAAITPDGNPAALYRVSSRSFPNRMAVLSADAKKVSIIPKPGHEQDITKNPYIAYNAAKLVGDYAILTNGSHTDPIAEKIALGLPPRDALALALLATDYEKDDYNTPRIASIVRRGSDTVWLGTVRHDGIDVQSFELEPGRIIHLSTYEPNIPLAERISPFAAETAEEACAFILGRGAFAEFTNPVTAVAAVAGKDGFSLALKDI
jgi:IMP cyclohydrolase